MVLTLGNWWQGWIPVERAVMFRLPSLHKHTALENPLLEMVTWMWPCGRSESTTWLDSFGICLLQKGVWKFLGCTFSCVVIEGRVVDYNMNSFSGTLFAILVYYLAVGDIDSGVVVGNVVFVNWPGHMIIVFFYSIFQTSAGFTCVRKVAIFFWAGPFIHYVLF